MDKNSAANVLLHLQIYFKMDVNVVCYEGRLTCIVPGNAPWQSCAGVQAAGTGTGLESAPPHLHLGPVVQKKANCKYDELTLDPR